MHNHPYAFRKAIGRTQHYSILLWTVYGGWRVWSVRVEETHLQLDLLDGVGGLSDPLLRQITGGAHQVEVGAGLLVEGPLLLHLSTDPPHPVINEELHPVDPEGPQGGGEEGGGEEGGGEEVWVCGWTLRMDSR